MAINFKDGLEQGLEGSPLRMTAPQLLIQVHSPALP
jgi:hypothetical protein